MMLILTWVIKYQSMYFRLAYNLKYNVVVIVLETSVKFESSPVCCNVVMAKLYNAMCWKLSIPGVYLSWMAAMLYLC